MHTHTPVYTYIRAYIDPSVNLRICLHTYTLVCVRCVFVRTYILGAYLHTYMRAYVHTVHPSMYLRTHMYVPMYALVGTHTFGVYKQGGWNANYVHSFSFW